MAELICRQLAPNAAVDVETHLADCPACRRVMAVLARSSLATGSADASGGGALAVGSSRLLSVGTPIGRYRIRELIGAGAMGVVYAAHDPDLDRTIALKLLHPELAADPAAARVDLFTEAQAMARIRHPNVVAVYDVGVHDERVYVAMELVAGESLRDWLEEPRPWRDAVRVLAAAGRGLAAAHALDLVHRDFKPENVLIGAREQVCVSDFGLARPSGATTTEIAGTPAYMAPEQRAGARPDPRADQYSFCVVLYEALAGARPGEASAARRGAVPARVRRVVERGLRAEPAERYASMDELLAALARDPARRVRRVAWGAGAVAGAAALAVIATSEPEPVAAPAVCADGIARLERAWNAEQRSVLSAALTGGGLYPAATVASLVRGVDDYAVAWRARFAGACEAAAGAGTELFARQYACFDDRAAALGARIAVLVQPDRTTGARAIELIAGLPQLGDCDAGSALLALPPLAGDPETRRMHAEARDALARAKALREAGKARDALAVLRPLRGLAYPPLESRIALELGMTEAELARSREADQTLGAAVEHALAARADDLLAKALAHRAAVRQLRFVDQERSEEYLSQALAVLERQARPPVHVAAEVYHIASQIYVARKDYAAATRSTERAIAARGPRETLNDRIDHANLQAELARIQRDQGVLARAYELFRAAHDALLRDLGEAHPMVGVVAAELAIVCERLGRIEEANRYFAATARGLGDSQSDDHQLAALMVYWLKPAAERDEGVGRENALRLIAIAGRRATVEETISILSMAAAFLLQIDDLKTSRHAAERAVALAADRPVEQLEVALLVLALCELVDGDLAPARQHVERALARARAAGAPDPVFMGTALYMQGMERYRSSQFTAALTAFEAAQRIADAERTEDTEEIDRVLPFWLAATRYRAKRPGATRAGVIALHRRLAADEEISTTTQLLMRQIITSM